MIKKHKLSTADIENDIISSIKYPADENKKSNSRWNVIAMFIAVFLFIALEWYGASPLWVIGPFLVYSVVSIINERIKYTYRIKKVTFNDYEVKYDVLTYKSRELYKKRATRKLSTTIENHSLYFKDLGEWRVQKKNYLWNGEFWMSDYAVYDSAMEGESYLVVVHKRTGKVAAAYPTDKFEYSL